MFICHSRQFYFVRVPKNASTSVAAFLINKFGDNNKDVWTRIHDAGIKDNNVPEKVINDYRKDYEFIHLDTQNLIKSGLLTLDQARTYHRIAIIREPFERQISLYKFLNRNKQQLSVDGFRKEFSNGYHEYDTNNKKRQKDYCWTPTEFFKIDGIWSYPYIERHLEAFCRERGVDYKSGNLSKYKFNGTNYRDVWKYYDEATTKVVTDYYLQDILLYGDVVERDKRIFG